MKIGKLSPDDLVLLITFIPQYEEVIKDGQTSIREKKHKIFAPESISPSWHHLYELSYHEHLARLIVDLGLADEVKQMAASTNPPKAGLDALESAFNSDDFNFELNDETSKKLPLLLGVTYSLYLNFKSLMTFGLYLNELVAIAAKGGKAGDKVIFQALKIDPTVIGCNCISARISQAMLEGDQKFLNKLRKSFLGKFTKRESKTYQLQRLILQILLETGAPKLSAKLLYELFVEHLKIASKDHNSDIGDVAENLRQFTYQFFKQKSVS
jgi:hypothetical protein